jgi:hypothetical protein
MWSLARLQEMCVSFSPSCLFPSHTRPKAAPDSDHLDSEDEAPAEKKRKLSKAAMEKRRASPKKKAITFDDDDCQCDDREEDAYTAPSKSPWKNKPSNSKPPIGSRVKCAKCAKQFTMVRFNDNVVNASFIFREDKVHDGCRPGAWLSLSPLY